jgi:hypothetical protein
MLQGSFGILSGWHLRVLCRPEDGAPFLISDFGWCNLRVGQGYPTASIFPLNSDCAVLAYGSSPNLSPVHKHGIDAHFTLVPSVMDVINATAWWVPETSWVAIHPDYGDYLLRLEASADVDWPLLGPYRGHQGGLFD